MRLIRILVVLAVAIPRFAQAQKYADDPRVQQALNVMKLWLDAQQAYQHYPSIAGALVKDQELVWSGGYGYADIERKVPATATTRYSICSISKLFTGVATMSLSDAGKLSITDPVDKYLPWFNIKQKFPGGEPIMVEGLMSHSSGLPRESDFPYWSGPDWPFPTLDQLKAKLGSQETIAAPETKNQYSNLAVSLEGWVDQAAAGMDYHDYVKKTILQPLGLTNTTSEMPRDQIGKQLAVGYGALHRGWTRPALAFFQARGIAPAAGYASTSEDLAKFAMWQFRLLKTNQPEILQPNTLRQMQRVFFVDPNSGSTYGLSFSVTRNATDGKTYVGHGGTCPGYQTDLRERPTEGIATIALINAADAGAGAISQGMYDIMAPVLLEVEKGGESNPKAAPIADPKLVSAYTGYYASNAETAVIPWGDGIALVPLGGATGGRGGNGVPVIANLARYRKTGENTFTRVQSGGRGRGAEPAADAQNPELKFIMGPDGKAKGYQSALQRSWRIEGQAFPF